MVRTCGTRYCPVEKHMELYGAVWSSETFCFFHLYLHVAQVLLLRFFFLNVLWRRRLDFDGDGLE